MEGERKELYLRSIEHKKAFENIDTSTNPRKAKTEQKRGIASEIIERGLISEEILRNFPIVYLGSGADVEYPLALGGRRILMVDYILKDPRIQNEIRNRVGALINQEVPLIDNKLTFEFDFGGGSEEVVVEIHPEVYNPPTEDMAREYRTFVPPQQVGVILSFAPQGPMGPIQLDEDIKSKVVEGGAIIGDNSVVRVNPATQQTEVIELGHVED